VAKIATYFKLNKSKQMTSLGHHLEIRRRFCVARKICKYLGSDSQDIQAIFILLYFLYMFISVYLSMVCVLFIFIIVIIKFIGFLRRKLL